MIARLPRATLLPRIRGHGQQRSEAQQCSGDLRLTPGSDLPRPELVLAEMVGAEVRTLVWPGQPQGWFLTNPSLCSDSSGFTVTAKLINYDTEAIIAQHDQRWEALDGDCMRVANVLMRCNADLEVESVVDIDETLARRHRPLAGWTEDYRCFQIGSITYVLGSGVNDCRRHDGNVWHTVDMRYRSFLASITSLGSLNVLRVFSSVSGIHCDKNWIPVALDHPSPGLDLIVNPATMARLQVRLQHPDRIGSIRRSHPFRRHPYRWQGPWSGSSAGMHCGDHCAVILHQRIAADNFLWYRHKLLLFDSQYNVVAESDPFVFETQAIEFCLGLAPHPDGCSVCISYGRRDKYSRVLTLPLDDFLALAKPC